MQLWQEITVAENILCGRGAKQKCACVDQVFLFKMSYYIQTQDSGLMLVPG